MVIKSLKYSLGESCIIEPGNLVRIRTDAFQTNVISMVEQQDAEEPFVALADNTLGLFLGMSTRIIVKRQFCRVLIDQTIFLVARNNLIRVYK